ncbi:MAG: hypothetical protein ACNS61_06595 [Candidatus Wenzhouxiangella sp. M2_3B_020]
MLDLDTIEPLVGQEKFLRVWRALYSCQQESVEVARVIESGDTALASL